MWETLTMGESCPANRVPMDAAGVCKEALKLCKQVPYVVR